jgi:hypothetical protein
MASKIYIVAYLSILHLAISLYTKIDASFILNATQQVASHPVILLIFLKTDDMLLKSFSAFSSMQHAASHKFVFNQ